MYFPKKLTLADASGYFISTFQQAARFPRRLTTGGCDLAFTRWIFCRSPEISHRSLKALEHVRVCQ